MSYGKRNSWRNTLDGAKNMAAVKAIANWGTNYPAFKHWDVKGFYIPAKQEVRTIFNNYTTIKTAVEKEGEIRFFQSPFNLYFFGSI
ncbi:MAG: hypothetical protein LBK03_04155 [Bacteroidales bacterium]|jgi:hypothetical protein|nr:hypothetical protein [Bacteroidales bacterium]